MSQLLPSSLLPALAHAAVPRSLRRLGGSRGLDRRGERGMATVEYAIGIVLVIAVVAAVIFAVRTDTFNQLLEQLLRALMEYVKGVFGNEAFAITKP